MTLSVWNCRHCGRGIVLLDGNDEWRHWPSLARGCSLNASPEVDSESKLKVSAKYVDALHKQVEARKLRGVA